MEAYATRPSKQLAVTKETNLATIDRRDVNYLQATRLTRKKTINTLFANTRDSFATAAKNAAGKKRLVSARAIYHFAAAPTREAANAHYAIVHIPLTQCCVVVSGKNNKADFLRFITVDAWQMAR